MTRYCAPENVSLLNPGEFRFFVHKAPYVSFFTQVVSIPSLNLQSVESGNPFTNLNFAGDHIDWEPLSVVFLVDEDLRGYREIYSWMRGLGFPETYEEYERLLDDPEGYSIWDDISSTVSVFTNTGSKNVNIEFIFQDAKPTMLSGPTLSTTHEGVPVVTCKAMFDYTLFDVRSVRP